MSEQDRTAAQVVRGPVVHPVNPSHDAAGSIHDDATASRLGFKGGTVAGDVLLDVFPPVLVEALGRDWFESGSLSLYFRHAIQHGDPVQVVLEIPADGPRDAHLAARLEQPDGALIAEGTASVGTPADGSALRSRDLRGCDPSELRILRDIAPGDVLDGGGVTVTLADQERRIARGFAAPVLPWYRGASPWGGPVAAPSTAFGLVLYAGPTHALAARVSDAGVGLFGAIEYRHLHGPVRLDEPYAVRAQVCAVGQSPQTEFVWYDATATDRSGIVVADMRLMTRFMKASSPLYA